MPRYTIDTLAPQIPYREAKRALEALDDSALIQRLTPDMTGITSLAWDVDEPEHEGLTHTLRVQALADLKTLYQGAFDARCDNHLGIGYDPTTGLPVLSVVSDGETGLPVLSVVSDGETDGDDSDYLMSNPVFRLRALGICNKPDPVQRIEDAILRPLQGWTHNVIRPATILANQVYLIDDLIPPARPAPTEDSTVF